MSSTRREFLKSAGLGAAAVAAGTGAGGLLLGSASAGPNKVSLALIATDGYITLPGRPAEQDVYIFGFREVPQNIAVTDLVAQYKQNAQHVAPILAFTQDDDIEVELTNLGLAGRPDLTDSHTIHWHGFRTPLAVFDGVPEVSIAVPPLRKFTYFYRPHDPGTYMYHCHFEDVEHVQMGMTGIVFVRPANTSDDDKSKWAYDHVSTRFDREFPILLNEIWTLMHDNDENIQETIHTDYNPDYFTLNGRVYPQTIEPTNHADLPGQPVSSLIQCKPGERVLLRLANLGYQQHAMQLPGIGMRVVGHDATLLRSADKTKDFSYTANTLYLGPGEARDVLFTAPAFNEARASDTDEHGRYNIYWFRNRSANKLSNPGIPGLGGMATQVRVYEGGLPDQDLEKPGETV